MMIWTVVIIAILFNTMKVFKQDGDNYYGPDAEYLYHESVTEAAPGDLHNWGEAMFPTKEFDVAKEGYTSIATAIEFMDELGGNAYINNYKILGDITCQETIS